MKVYFPYNPIFILSTRECAVSSFLPEIIFPQATVTTRHITDVPCLAAAPTPEQWGSGLGANGPGPNTEPLSCWDSYESVTENPMIVT